jgi:hypothetical protein
VQRELLEERIVEEDVSAHFNTSSLKDGAVKTEKTMCLIICAAFFRTLPTPSWSGVALS